MIGVPEEPIETGADHTHFAIGGRIRLPNVN